MGVAEEPRDTGGPLGIVPAIVCAACVIVGCLAPTVMLSPCCSLGSIGAWLACVLYVAVEDVPWRGTRPWTLVRITNVFAVLVATTLYGLGIFAAMTLR